MPSISKTSVDSFVRSKGVRGPHPIGRHRQIRNRFHRIFSIKAGNRIVVAESQLEADAIFWAESQPKILSICEQPMRIEGALDKKPYYTFDLGIVFENGEEIFLEIKPIDILSESGSVNKEPEYWFAVEKWCKANGFKCGIKTDEELQSDSQLIRNWRLLLGYVRTSKELSLLDLEKSVTSILEMHGSLSTADLVNYIPNNRTDFILPAIARLLHSGIVDAQLDKIIFTPHTALSLSK